MIKKALIIFLLAVVVIPVTAKAQNFALGYLLGGSRCASLQSRIEELEKFITDNGLKVPE